MNALSASTRAADPYRAGLELGEALRGCRPEVVFLFSTIHYGDDNELVNGLYDAVGYDDLILIGNTGDGFYESRDVGDIGASALALASDGKVRWHLAHAQGLGTDAVATTRTALARLRAELQGKSPAFVYIASDFRVDASEIERVIEHETSFPVVGGFAADDNQMDYCAVYVNRQALGDTVALLAAEGSVSLQIHIGNALTPVGRPGVVNDAEGVSIRQINGISAMEFIEIETGKPVLQSDRGITSLTVVDTDQPEIKRLRSIVPKQGQDGFSLGLYGGIEVGRTIQVCLAHPDELIQEVYSLAQRSKQSGFEPAAALVVSCAGRKWLLGERVGHEVRALSESFGDNLPITGFPSFGEIGPLRMASGYSRNLFHNMTYVLLLIGKD